MSDTEAYQTIELYENQLKLIKIIKKYFLFFFKQCASFCQGYKIIVK